MKYLTGALVANAASLGFHWIYNPEYLEALSTKESLLFQKQDPNHYQQAKPSYYVYPDNEVGTFTLQGNMLKWLYDALLENPKMTQKDYQDLIFDYLRPGGSYVGYVESYTKRLVINYLAKDIKLPIIDQPLMDDHLVGFIPYLACRELGLGNYKAWELAQAFTTLKAYPAYYQMFDYIFDHIHDMPLKDLLKQAISIAPETEKIKLEHAISMDDTRVFIASYAGIACHIPQSIPLIIHLLAHENDYENLIHTNTKLGGASSDRGLILGAIMSQISPIPKTWISKTTL